jgi:short-subunit dehydrogenase/thioester reductase-like protein
MDCFVTGATGFLGRYLIRELLARAELADARIYALTRDATPARLDALREWWGAESARVVAVSGELRSRALAVSAEDRARLRGVAHFFHLAAVYDLEAAEEAVQQANVAGTVHALELARDVRAGCFHLVSSIAVAGAYPGTFTEDMFAEAVGLDHPYFRTKHESEAVVRRETRTPWRIYRPGMIVGDSATGHITKIDGPYYFFTLLKRLRAALPPWFPAIGIEGGFVNVVPVDYVARAIVHLALVREQDGRCFHLTDPEPRRVGPLLNLFARAAHAPQMSLRLDASVAALAPRQIVESLEHSTALRAVVDNLLHDLRLPRDVLRLLHQPTLFDNVRARRLLEPAGIRLPRLETYAWRLWDYWERRLDPDLATPQSIEHAVRDKRVLITGGAAGIGFATAVRLCDAGAHVLIVDRDAQRLAAARESLQARGGRVSAYECDLTEALACNRFIAGVLAEHGGVDVLVNNAGHSIRRSIEISYERLHDYERLMSLNYLAAVRLTLAFLPGMVERGDGHVIAVSSIGVLSSQPRFSAYIASKAALEAFTRSASAEFRDRGVSFTVINLPLVRTAMSAPTRAYARMRMLSPEEAAQHIVDALVHKPARIVTPLGRLAQALEALSPGVVDIVNNAAFHMYPDSAAARGVEEADDAPTSQAADFERLLKAVHWG